MLSGADELRARFLQQAIELYGKEVILDLREPAGVGSMAAPAAAAEASPSGPLGVYATLDEFHQFIQGCLNCALGHSRKRFVFGSGDPKATLMFVGEAPGQEEDEQGLPFVGAAGQLLTKIIGVAGFSREEVYIANILKCRPPGNRVPLPEEVEQCMPYLHRQIDMIGPRYIFCLGRTAAQSLLGVAAPLGQLRQDSYRFGSAKVFITYHPSALLRNPAWRWDCFDDLKRFRAVYDAEVGDKPPMPPPDSKKKN